MIWAVCPLCGSVVADDELHESWHASLGGAPNEGGS